MSSVLVTVNYGHRVNILMSQMRNFYYSHCRLLLLLNLDDWLDLGLLLYNRLLHNRLNLRYWLNHRLLHLRGWLDLNHWLLNMRLFHFYKDTFLSAFSPVSEVQMMNMKSVLKHTTSNMIRQMEMITFLYNSMVEEHTMSASMTEEFLFLSHVRSWSNCPFSDCVKASFQINSKLAFFNTVTFIIPIKRKFEMSSTAKLHSGHISYRIPTISYVSNNRHRVYIFMSQFRNSSRRNMRLLLRLGILLDYYLRHRSYDLI